MAYQQPIRRGRGPRGRKADNKMAMILIGGVLGGMCLIGIAMLVVSGSRGGSRSSGTSGTPSVSAAISNFQVDGSDFVFNVSIKNRSASAQTYYVVVYGKNDMYIPPRRSAWPLPGLLFSKAETARGNLSPSDISRDWRSSSEDTKGWKIVLPASGSNSIEGALPINSVSQLKAWEGQAFASASLYNEIHLWVFSSDGVLIWNKTTSIE